MAPPICWFVLMRPDWSPASLSEAPDRAAIETGTNAKPSPTPMRKKPGSRSATYEPSAEICVKKMSPAASRPIPAASTGFTPAFVVRACATPEATTAVSATAR